MKIFILVLVIFMLLACSTTVQIRKTQSIKVDFRNSSVMNYENASLTVSDFGQVIITRGILPETLLMCPAYEINSIVVKLNYEEKENGN